MDPSLPAAPNPKYAWRNVPRVEPPKRPAADRVADFREIYGPYDETTASEQASRCIQCPNPTCVEACPLDSPIPELLALTAEGRFLEAAKMLFSTHSMPELFAHVCAAERMCEAACVLGAKADPVPIGSIGRFLLDYGWKHGISEPALATPTGQRVAIIGSGLCGLVGADELSRLGYAVTVFDSYPKPGGRLANGLPGFRVDKALIERRVDLLAQRGVQFRMEMLCGRDLKLGALRHEFDAVFFALGRAHPVRLEIPGANLRGVRQAYPFVLQNTAEVAIVTPPVPVRGRRVVVLGAGETAMDALRVAIRCGASEAVCVCRRDAANMAASPKQFQDAVEEGAHFLFLSEPIALLGNAAGEVTHVRCVRTKLGERDAAGRLGVCRIPDSEFDVPADVVLVACGFTPPRLTRVDEFAELGVDERGYLMVDVNQMTNLPGVFAGGSIVRGGNVPLVEVVRDAHRAAVAIDRYLAARRVSLDAK
jgi:glutamate synthase (NADPH/NADH) small chain